MDIDRLIAKKTRSYEANYLVKNIIKHSFFELWDKDL